MIKCPHCEKPLFVPGVCYRHTEAYGSRTLHWRCEKCDKVVAAHFGVCVVMGEVRKSRKDIGDWG